MTGFVLLVNTTKLFLVVKDQIMDSQDDRNPGNPRNTQSLVSSLGVWVHSFFIQIKTVKQEFFSESFQYQLIVDEIV